jgi:hypothetical protein
MAKLDMDTIRRKGAENRARLLANGWPENPSNQRYFWLKPYGRVLTAFVKGKGFYFHLESDPRVAFGRDYETALKAMVRILEPDAENIEVG